MKKIIPFLLFLIIICIGCGSSNVIFDEDDLNQIVDSIQHKTDTTNHKTDSTSNPTDTTKTSTDSTKTNTDTIPPADSNTYQNPIIKTSLPDPTIIKVGKTFYLYATEDIRNTPIYKSDNLIDWEYVGTAFTDKTRPSIVAGGGIWAPDINYINGKYVLYYSQSVWGGEWTCGVGIAVSNKPEGPFKDLGKLFNSKDIDVQNSIDPFYYEENGHKYLFWGSLRGIYGIELSSDGLSLKEGTEKQKIAGSSIEGTYIYKHNNFYYLFASHGSCCNGASSTYKVVVGRSENLFGPYITKTGRTMLGGSYDVILKGNDFVAGPGHNAEFIHDKNGDDWIIYHGFLKADPSAGRQVFMDKIIWDDGWPSIKNDSPSESSDRPVLK